MYNRLLPREYSQAHTDEKSPRNSEKSRFGLISDRRISELSERRSSCGQRELNAWSTVLDYWTSARSSLCVLFAQRCTRCHVLQRYNDVCRKPLYNARSMHNSCK